MRAEFPEALEFLFEPARYKVVWGGRGKGQSWGFARALLLLGARRKLRVLCARETMRSLADSVHALLADQIPLLELESFYRVQESTIRGANGTEFIFAGLKHNISNIKSLEAVDILWMEEAESISRDSWQTIIPTIRKDPANIYDEPHPSEIWVGFNPKLNTDETYKRMVLDPPPDAAVRKLSWRDNPWFPEILRIEKDHLQLTDADAYAHVWEGECQSAVKGAIYGDELIAAEREGRITKVSYDRTRPVQTFWDLGFGDSTAIWFAQATEDDFRLIDYLENKGKTLEWYFIQLQDRKYLYGTHWIPWDGLKPQRLGSGRSIEELFRASGKDVRMVTMLPVHEGLNAARTIFPRCWFDADKCADGLSCLRRYQWGELNPTGIERRLPLHNQASHAADAFRYFATAIKHPEREYAAAALVPSRLGPDAWMG